MPINDGFSLPVAPDELCFDKNEFIKKTFSVDEFLHEHRNAAGLEQMRDDLGIYLKVLRSAMIELINEDYVDFVNLSSNLIGLDQSINGIQVSLSQLKEEILTVKMILTDTMTDLSNCLDEKKLLKNHLNSIRCVAKVRTAIRNLEELLDNKLSESDEHLVDPVILERAALELIQLEFDMQFCGNLIEKSQGQNRMSKLNRKLMNKLENYFLSMLNKNHFGGIEKSLRIYGTLDEFQSAEEIVRKHIVAPHMHLIISESSLQNCPNGLPGIYAQIINFIETKMTYLLKLTLLDGGKVKGFDFIVNSFWQEIEKRLETHMSSIFAPGNPDLFYQKYKSTVDFLNQLETILCNESDIENWKNHSQYKNFQTKWNLPVYFQIRFQEIGGTLEKACSLPIDKNLIKTSNEFKLIPFTTAWSCLLNCWSPGIYLSEIFVRFWTLTVQQIFRIVSWIDECIEMKKFSPNENAKISKIDFYIYIYKDAKTLIDKLPVLLGIIFKNIPKNVKGHEKLLENGFSDATDMLCKRLELIEDKIAKEILDQSLGNIKQVNDIPRLYRKTNKEIPTKPCLYVDQIIEPSRNFYQQHGEKFSNPVLHAFLIKTFSSLNAQYYTAVNDVLTSVQKTEESLRRLKNLREKSLANSSSSERLGISDDDKIRLQLYVDVMHWTTELEKLGIQRTDVHQLINLISLLEEVTKIRNLEGK